MSLLPISIAYADDHTLVRKAIINYISEGEHLLVDIEAENGQDLINKLETSPKMPDLCLIDVSMPVMNGFDTLIEIKKRWPDMSTLILSVFDDELYIIRMIMSGANGYLLKNCSPGELKNAIESVYNNGYYYNSQRVRKYYKMVENKEIKLPRFTPNELEVLKYSCSDLSYSEIANRMGKTSRSIEGYRDSLFRKLNINSRVGLVIHAIKFGIVTI
ncbi:MAG: response regulator transcription factor [Flavipsychrobacter sp.]